MECWKILFDDVSLSEIIDHRVSIQYNNVNKSAAYEMPCKQKYWSRRLLPVYSTHSLTRIQFMYFELKRVREQLKTAVRSCRLHGWFVDVLRHFRN